MTIFSPTPGDDLFVGTAVSETIVGGDGGDQLYGQDGNDLLQGDSGNDQLIGGNGADTLEGGTGDDSLVTDSLDVVLAGDGDDVIVLYAYGDALQTGSMDGGSGHDRVVAIGDVSSFDFQNIEVLSLVSDVRMSVANLNSFDEVGINPTRLSIDFAGLGGRADLARATNTFGTPSLDIGAESLTSALNLKLGAGNDSVLASRFDDAVLSGHGNDSLIGGEGNDTLWGGSGDDTIRGGEGNDVLGGVLGTNRLVGGSGDDVYWVLNTFSSDIIELNGGGTDTVVVSGESGPLPDHVENLQLRTKAGQKVYAYGNDLDNVMTGFAGDDTFVPGAGNDTVQAGSGSDTVYAGAGDDSLAGGAGNDDLNGEVGDDTISGGAGRDRLYSTDGQDSLIGGSGRDLFVLADALKSHATIADFATGEDHLEVIMTGFPGLVLPPGATSATLFEIGSEASSSQTRILFDPGSSILYYDPDGLAGADKILLAHIMTTSGFAASDITII